MDNLKVEYNGKGIVLNKDLLDQQKCWHNLETIKALHARRLELVDKMTAETEAGLLRKYNEEYSYIQFDLQDAWLFPRDAKFHRFWEVPHCSCPKLDNEDRYPTGLYVINKACILHGGDVDEEDRSWAV